MLVYAARPPMPLKEQSTVGACCGHSNRVQALQRGLSMQRTPADTAIALQGAHTA